MPSPVRMIVTAGIVAGALAAIWGAVALATPILSSDPPPLAGRAVVERKLQQYAQTIETLQRNNAALQQHQVATDANVDLMRLDLLEAQLERARQDLRANPNSSSARLELCTLIDKIDRARARNGLPLIALPPSC